MKILLGMPSKDSWGGPISSEPPFVNAMRDLNVDVTEEIYVYGDKEKPTPFFQRVKRVFLTAFRFRKLLKHNDFDLVHLNTAFDLKTILRDSFSLLVMQPGRAKVFFKIHGSEAQELLDTNFLVRRLIRFLSTKADGFGVHTNAELDDFMRLGFDKKKFHLVKNAIDVSISPSRRRRQKNPDERFDLLFASRFVPRKCLVETIKACQRLLHDGYDITLTCVGDGETREAAEKLVKTSQLSDRVTFTGYVSEAEVTSYLTQNDILIFPTRFGEGFPNVFFKAVVQGMPIVSTSFRAVSDYLEDGENCLVCTPEPEDIADKIARLIGDLPMREEMSQKNLEFGKLLSAEAIANDFLQVYKEVLDNS